MKKIMVMILTIFLLFSFCSCGVGETESEAKETVERGEFFGRLIPIEDSTHFMTFEDGLGDTNVRYFYDKETKVVYYYMQYRSQSQCFGPQIMYNADGTLVTYNEK